MPASASASRLPPRSETTNLTFRAVSALACALWIAICAAAPEFIWQGLRIVSHHFGWTELLSALLIGLILAFFVEPLVERVRDALHAAQSHHEVHHKPADAIYTAALGLAFALASVCVHDAITSFVSGRGAHPPDPGTALVAGIELATSWALVPFTITLAWLSAWRPWLRIATGAIAAASSCITAWLFAWGVQSALTTTVPCVLILGFGYARLAENPAAHPWPACARVVAAVGAVWLLAAFLFEVVLEQSGWTRISLYTPSTLWEDARFYLGWTFGLLLAPWPLGAAHRPNESQ